MSARDVAGVIAPPPLIFAGLAGLGLLADWLLPLPALGLPPALRWALGLAGASAGTALILAALRQFRRAGTPPEPWEPTRAFVASGVYRFTRNPMYLGMALLMLAVAAAFDSLGALIGLPLALLVIDRGVIAREEPYMAARFGEEYLSWKRRVRRWI